jgi:mono/diheme cytochrome c family protein
MIPAFLVKEIPMFSLQRGLPGILLACLITVSSLLALQGPQPQSVSDGVFTDSQAARGQTIYRARCASCHGNAMEGRTGPVLTGADFLANWESQPVLELASKIRNTMPRDESARLSRQETADLVAYMLQTAKFKAGNSELQSDDTSLKSLRFPAGSGAAKAAPPASQPTLPPSGNVAQVMRGILFHSSNIVFTVQSIDPAAKKPQADVTDGGGFDWLTWGGGVYRGWDVVDYAAISVAESATLLLTPGRRCENGRLAPVTDPDWIRFTKELADAGNASYKASQARNQELVSDSTNRLSESCNSCHRVYRGRTHCVK